MEPRNLLQSTSLEDFLLTRPPSPVITLSPSDSLAGALHRLNIAKIISAPLVDDSSEYYGLIDLFDILSALFETADVLNPRTPVIAQIPSLQNFLETTQISAIPRANDAQLIHEYRKTTDLLEVVYKGFVNPANKLFCHRLAVTRFLNADEDSMEDTEIEITSIISQSDIIQFLYSQRNSLPTFMASKLNSLGLGVKKVYTVSHDLRAVDAFRALVSSGTTAAAIVDKETLVGNLSPSDLRGLTLENLASLDLPLLDYLASKRSENLHAPNSLAAAYGVKPSSLAVENAAQYKTVATCLETSAVEEVLRIIVERGVHRVWIVEEITGKPVGVVSLTDILRSLFSSS